MAWASFAVIVPTNRWQFTNPIDGGWFRVRSVISEPPPWGWYGHIGQARGGFAAPELFGVRRLYHFPEAELIELPVPLPLDGQRRIAVRGQRKFKSAIAWTIFIDRWV